MLVHPEVGYYNINIFNISQGSLGPDFVLVEAEKS
jgi:hypothetical protein